MIYGPGDYARRFHPVLKRIDDGRPFILYEQGRAAWRAPRGYVENVAAALRLAVTKEEAAGRIYNVAEAPAYSELEWARKIAAATQWKGEFMVLPNDRTPIGRWFLSTKPFGARLYGSGRTLLGSSLRTLSIMQPKILPSPDRRIALIRPRPRLQLESREFAVANAELRTLPDHSVKIGNSSHSASRKGRCAKRSASRVARPRTDFTCGRRLQPGHAGVCDPTQCGGPHASLSARGSLSGHIASPWLPEWCCRCPAREPSLA
jgi:hypothetical protein